MPAFSMDKIKEFVETYDNNEEYKKISKKIVYTGMIDEYFNYKFGKLEYRSLKFDTKILDCENFQGNAVVNYTGKDKKYTRIIEHKHFEKVKNNNKTVISYEYPMDWKNGDEPYYVVNDKKNNKMAEEYRKLASKEKNVIFGGRLAEYKYYDMDDVIKAALNYGE